MVWHKHEPVYRERTRWIAAAEAGKIEGRDKLICLLADTNQSRTGERWRRHFLKGGRMNRQLKLP